MPTSRRLIERAHALDWQRGSELAYDKRARLGAAAQPLNIAAVLNRDALSDREDDETRRFLAAHDHPRKERILRELDANRRRGGR